MKNKQYTKPISEIIEIDVDAFLSGSGIPQAGDNNNATIVIPGGVTPGIGDNSMPWVDNQF